MKYKLRREIDESVMDEIITTVDELLYMRGIDDFAEYQELSEYDTCDYHNLDNIDKAVSMLLTHIRNNSCISILVDTDPDGYTSAAAIYNYLKTKVNNVWYIMHNKPKGHGLADENDVNVPLGTNLLIVPDAGTNDFEQCNVLNQLGVDVLILDHHVADSVVPKRKHTIVINNQISDAYSNKSFSGVGVVYKFLQAMDDALGIEEADNYLDLVALGNISDVMDAKSFETRYYIEQGLQHIKNKAFKALLEAQEYSTKGVVNMHTIAWYISSVMNGCMRYGKPEERELLFRAFIETDEEFDYKKRGGETVKEDIYTRAARLCKNAKSRQDKARSKGVNQIIEHCKEYITDEDKVIIVDVTDILERELTGVAAIKVAETMRRPCILLSRMHNTPDGERLFGGSGRNYDHSPVEDFKSECLKTGAFEFAQGHANAFGVQIKGDNIITAQKIFNKNLANLDVNSVYLVDEIYDESIYTDECISYSDFADYIGNGLDEPTVAVEGLTIFRGECKVVGSKKDTIQINSENDSGIVKYVLFKRDDDDKLLNWINNTWNDNDSVILNIVGEPGVNEYDGIRSAQFIVKDYELAEGEWPEYEDLDDIWGE